MNQLLVHLPSYGLMNLRGCQVRRWTFSLLRTSAQQGGLARHAAADQSSECGLYPLHRQSATHARFGSELQVRALKGPVARALGGTGRGMRPVPGARAQCRYRQLRSKSPQRSTKRFDRSSRAHSNGKLPQLISQYFAPLSRPIGSVGNRARYHWVRRISSPPTVVRDSSSNSLGTGNPRFEVQLSCCHWRNVLAPRLMHFLISNTHTLGSQAFST